MLRVFLVFCLLGIGTIGLTYGETVIVLDFKTNEPLIGASVFDKAGNVVGITGRNGVLRNVERSKYPLVIRYIGYDDAVLDKNQSDTVFLKENLTALPEIVVDSRKHSVLHMLGYVREYSTLTTFHDTVFLFREKMVDFMVPMNQKMKFKGWKTPRVLNSMSYYHFTNDAGLDSVSDKCSLHFSWCDWIGLFSELHLPCSLINKSTGVDTVMGWYSPAEIWRKNDERLNLYVNVLADTLRRKWVPNLSSFFKNNIEFEQFRLRYNFDNITDSVIEPLNLINFSFNIDSEGRGHDMLLFNKPTEKYFVSTFAEVFLIDKEFITEKEAKNWTNDKLSFSDLTIYAPDDISPLPTSILSLKERVDNIDISKVRSELIADERLKFEKVNRSFGGRILQRLKGMVGIDAVRGQSKRNKEWRQFKQNRLHRNYN